MPGPAGAGEGTVSDPREFGTQLDVKGLTHTDDGSAVVYTAETYAPFTDQSAAFQWGIDKDGDEDFDLFVVTEWRAGKLAGGVKNAVGEELAVAGVSRPGPNAIQVSFPVAALGGTGAYRYAVNAGAPGGDLAPDAGLSQHRLGSVVAPSGSGARTASAPIPVAPQPNLPTTGPDDGEALLSVAGAALMLGGALITSGSRRGSTLMKGLRCSL